MTIIYIILFVIIINLVFDIIKRFIDRKRNIEYVELTEQEKTYQAIRYILILILGIIICNKVLCYVFMVIS